MALRDALQVRAGDVVAFIGAGGKTSALRRLAAEWAAAGRRVLLLSTTKIEAQSGGVETVVAGNLDAAVRALRSEWRAATPRLLVTERLTTRWRGVPVEWVAALAQLAEVDEVLVQADGSARRPFKAPAEHEPVIPPCAALAVAVMGIDAIGQPIDERRVHRPERVSDLSGLPAGSNLTPEGAARVLIHPRGGFRAAPARRALLINKVDSPAQLALARAVAEAVRARTDMRIVAASLRAEEPVMQVWADGTPPLLEATRRSG